MARTALGPIPWPWMNKALAYQNKKFEGDGIKKGMSGQENGKDIENIFYISIFIFYNAYSKPYII